MSNKLYDINKLPYLNTIKFWACIGIVLFHYRCNLIGTDYYGPFPFGDYIFQNGSLLVELFFLISGFLIDYNYAEKICDISFLTFFGGRIQKLIAPVWLGELLMGVVYPTFDWWLNGNICFPSLYHWLQSLSFTATGYIKGDNVYPIAVVTWYVNILLLLYVYYWGINKYENKNKYAFYILMIFIGYFCIYFWNSPLLWASNGRGMASFFTGTLLCQIIKKNKKYNMSRISLIMFGTTVVILLFGHRYGYEYICGDIRMLSIFLMYPSIVLFPIYHTNCKKVLEVHAFQKISSYSLYIYLTHFFVQKIWASINSKLSYTIEFNSIRWIIVVLLSTVIFSVVFKMMLLWFNKLLKKVYYYLISNL